MEYKEYPTGKVKTIVMLLIMILSSSCFQVMEWSDSEEALYQEQLLYEKPRGCR